MKKGLFLLCLFFIYSGLFAQNGRPNQILYTVTAEKYLSEANADSLLYGTTKELFIQNLIPLLLFEEKYQEIKKNILQYTKADITLAFKNIEAGLKKNLITETGSVQFIYNQNLYFEAFKTEVRNAFKKYRDLSRYISFYTSDRITYFNSTVTIKPDGKLLVNEIIKIYNGNGQTNPIYGNDVLLTNSGALNDEIKRGIVRAFPLYYINKYKLFQNTTFKVLEVLRDGKEEEYRTEKKDNGILLFLGNKNIYLNNGSYTYSITYETDHQLKQLAGFDELYWNVTGNSWSFRIDSAKCTVLLPKKATPLSARCYSGIQGATQEDCSFTSITTGDQTTIVFKTTKPLLPNNGFTIANSWEKGFIKRRGMLQQMGYYFWNNKAVFLLPFAALFSSVFLFIFWKKYGRDPEKGTIYPQFEPPAGFSPAALGYIYYQKFIPKLTASMIVDAAVRNKIKIEVKRKGIIFKHNEYAIKGSSDPEKPGTSNYEDFSLDMEDLKGSEIAKGKYNSELGSLNTKIKAHCEKTYKNKDGVIKNTYKGFFALNNTYTAIPILVCIAAAVWGFAGGLVKALQMMNFWQVLYYFIGIYICVRVLKIFARLLAAYNIKGRHLMDKIEGFRMFLSTADETRFNTMNPPTKSLELYEKYLPFAIALGCEVDWGEKFEEIIETAYLDGSAASSFSQSFSHNSNSFNSTFSSSFSGAISSASTPPSSSSSGGSSGGGSSGGGGGGGGGGGW